MNEKANEFRREVKELMKRYDARYGEGEHRDREENPCGETQYIIVDGERFELGDLID